MEISNNDQKHETLTKAKIKRAESAILKGSTCIRSYSRLTALSFEMPASF